MNPNEPIDDLAAYLRELPAPPVPPELLARTQARVLAELTARAERRWNDVAAGVLILFAWAVALATWSACRLFAEGVQGLGHAGVTAALTWLTGSTLMVWITAGVAVLLLGNRRQLKGRVYEPLS